MILKVNFLSGIPTYRQITDGIKEEIASGRLKPMDELPSVRNMAIQLKINPNTVSHAYKELINEGVIFSRQGMGFYIRPVEEKNLQSIAEGIKKSIIEAKVRNLTKDELELIVDRIIGDVYDKSGEL